MKILFSLLLVFSIFVPIIDVSAQDTTEATPKSLTIFQVKTEGQTATEEYVLLYNSSTESVDVESWCIEYSSSNDNVGFKSCITSSDIPLIVDPGSFASFGTAAFTLATNFSVDYVFTGGMSSSGGHLRLYDNNDTEIDRVGWGSAIHPESNSEPASPAPTKHDKSQALSRDTGSSQPDTDDNFADFTSKDLIYQCPVSGMILSAQYYVDDIGMCVERFCPNLLTSTTEAPEGYFKPDGQVNCELIPEVLEDSVLFITELYPNAPSTDTGQEFIEIFNPNSVDIELEGYRIQVGPSYLKEFIWGSGSISANGYAIYSDTTTGLILPNSAGVALRLIAPNGDLVSETTTYSNAQDDESWSLLEDQWIWTNQITPGKVNKPFLVPAVNEVEGVTSVLAPCPAGKFRNPDTNRCKTIETAVSVLTPCDEDEFRNPETNRCNKSSSSGSSLTPCSSGQVRNPDTNRCRSVTSSSSLTPCKEGQERNPETNRCRNVAVLGSSTELSNVTDIAVESSEGQLNWPIIVLSVSATFLYMLYEWRSEISYKIRRIQARA